LELEMARRVAEECRRVLGENVAEVRLFGSRARGTAHPDSDLDLLVLTRRDDLAVREAVHEAAVSVALAMHWPFTPAPTVMSQEHFQRLLDGERRFALDVEAEGLRL